MREISSYIWSYPANARCVTTNGVVRANGCLVMGAGIAKEALRRYPGIDFRFGSLVKLFGNIPFLLPEHSLISFPTKDNWRDKSNIDLIVASAHHLVRLANLHGFETVALPRPGCGLGGLTWSDVKSAIWNILDDRFVVVSITGDVGSNDK